jgi:flagellar basal body P-ring protein FlgI
MNDTQKINFISSLVKEVIDSMDEKIGYASIRDAGTLNLNQAHLFNVLDFLNKIEEVEI